MQQTFDGQERNSDTHDECNDNEGDAPHDQKVVAIWYAPES